MTELQVNLENAIQTEARLLAIARELIPFSAEWRTACTNLRKAMAYRIILRDAVDAEFLEANGY